MKQHSKCAFQITQWDQTVYDAPEEGPALARVQVKRLYTGEIEAEGAAELLLSQSAEGNGYLASERVTGRIGDRTGTFVIQHGGAVTGEDEIVTSFGYVVPGSATGDLRGLRGTCSWIHNAQEATFVLDYEFL